ncbi:hypothetical protein MMJ61_01015 [Enterococcus cecorum]|uniref:hypothetical protein n=1 Tax=Enterococcus cecorum TaxID=44008 RepID=UPI001FADE8CA|nr:hypothetical protein [Enterococcus cecorum]MCJ0570785.1 hypothetical protein [Enterococcus cecorum]MCJ0589193.1 hypothetical protein [Enterococcus cecorum]MDZ5578628.1 hypothetical protein [Enterococcus cecorum]
MKKKILTLGLLLFSASIMLAACSYNPGYEDTSTEESTEDTVDLKKLSKELAQESKEKAEAEKEAKEAEERARQSKEREEKAEAERKDPNSYENVDYITLARNPENYIGKKLKFSGKILQVIEGSSSTEYRLAVNNDYDNVVYMSISNDDLPQRILEDDLVTVYGVSTGKITYESTLGGNITIPSMVIYMFNIDGHED